MKKKEIGKVLELLDQKDLSSFNFNEFRNPDEVIEGFNLLSFFRGKHSESRSDFSPFFTEKVMGRIAAQSHTPGIEDYLSMQFNRVITYGLTAVVALFLVLWFLHGQDGIGTLIGTDSSNDLNFISYLFYEF